MIQRVLAVARKELGTLLLTPIGPVLLFVFGLLAAWWFFFLQRFFVRGEASVQGLFAVVSILHLVFAPAVTMRLWAEERRNGTYEVLMTLPVRAHEWVLGKYCAACAFLALWLASLVPALLVVEWFGDPDRGPLWAGLLGCFLLGASYLAIGCCVSAFTENQIIALICAIAVSLFFYLLHHDMLRSLFPGFLGTFLHQLSLETHFQSMRRGVLDSRDFVFFASFIGFCLYANTKVVQRVRPHPFNLLLAAALAGLVVGHAQRPAARWDWTEERRFTLSAPTLAILDRVDRANPVVLTAYFSRDVPAQWLPALRDTTDLLQEFAARANGRVELRIVDPGQSAAAAEEVTAQRIRPVPLPAGDASSFEVKAAYQALVVESAETRSVIEAVPMRNTAELEYQLAQRIARGTRAEPLKIGFQQCDGAQLGARNLRGGRDRHSVRGDFSRLEAVVAQRFETTVVDLDQPVAPEVAVLIVANDEKLNRVELFYLDQFVMRGGRLALLSAGTVPSAIGASVDKPWIRAPSAAQAAGLYSAWGIRVLPDVVLDALRHDVELVPALGGLRPVPQPAIPLIYPDTMADHPTRAGVAALRLPYPSSIEIRPHPEVRVLELWRTSANALHDQSSFLDLSPEGRGSVPDPKLQIADYNQEFLLAVWLEGRFRSAYTTGEFPEEIWQRAALQPEQHSLADLQRSVGFQSQSPAGAAMLVVGCADFLGNRCLELRDDNLVFFLNALDLLAGVEDLSSLRAKRFLARSFAAPSAAQKSMGLFLGTFLLPLAWLSLGVYVYWVRRVLRPSRARRARTEQSAGA